VLSSLFQVATSTKKSCIEDVLTISQASKGAETFPEPKEISGPFDGGMKTYGRGVKCTGQAEGGDSDAVFILKDGATLSNVIIGEDQIEGIHCEGSCTLKVSIPH
jgi:hypothetical protein